MTQLSVSAQYGHYPRLLDGDDELAGDEVLDAATVTLAVRHHFGEGWAVDAAVPVGLAVLQAPLAASEGVSGFGDIGLGARYELGALWGVGGYMPSVTLRLGIDLPTGARATTSAAGSMPSALRLGTGAFGVVGEVQYTQFLTRRFALSVPLSVRAPLTIDSDGSTPAARFGVGIEALILPTEWLVLRVAFVYQHVGQLDIAALGPAVNSGGNWLRAEGLALFRIDERVSLGAGAGAPFYASVNGQQLVEVVNVSLVAAVTFGGESEEEHQHDHEGESGSEGGSEGGSESGGGGESGSGESGSGESGSGESGSEAEGPVAGVRGDVRDAARGGETFEVAGVIAAGRVTVIDFWADWCHPCEHIDALLRRLARRHPELAVRRVEVPSEDAPVAREHLPDDARLPQIWIYDESGRRIERLSGVGEERVREAVEAALR